MTCKESHSCCHGPTAPLEMWDSETSTVLSRYESMRLFAKVKEPLRGTWYNTRDELIRAIGQAIRNINKDGRAHDLRLPNIWQMVLNKGATILKVHKCCTPVYKAMSEILNFSHYFSSTLVYLGHSIISDNIWINDKENIFEIVTLF